MDEETAYSGSAEPTLVAGAKIQVLNLHVIQERLGEKWQKMSALVHKYFEAAIRSALGPDDVFCHRGELEYLIAFHNTPLAEARLKCVAISQFACERLFGKDGEDLVVRAVTAPLAWTDFSSLDDQMQADWHLEDQGEEVLCTKNGEKAKSSPRRMIDGVSLGDEQRHQVRAENTPFVFRPFWDSDRQVLLSYLAQPLPDTCLPTSHFYGPPTAMPEHAQSELDILCLKAVHRRIQAVRGAGRRLLIAAPLHFTTLSRQRYWLMYRDIASAISPVELADVLFVLHGIDAGVPNVRLVQELPKLAVFARRLFCIAQDPGQIQRQFHNTNVQAVGAVVRAGEPERVLIERLQKLHIAARAAGMESFLLGAPRRSVVINAIGAGARYIEGVGMRGPVVEPKFALAQDITDYCRMTERVA